MLCAAGEIGVSETEPPLPDPDPGPPPPPPRGDPLLDLGVDSAIFEQKRSQILLSSNQTNTLFKVFKKKQKLF